MSGMSTGDRTAMQRSIAGRLLFWFLVIALIPCAILTAITARIAATALETAVRDNLVQIAAAKADELEAYAGERVRAAAALARGPTFVKAMQDLAGVAADASPADRRARLDALGKDFASYSTYVATAFGYADLLLIDGSGRVVYALDDAIPTDTLVTGGGSQTLAIRANGELWSWGLNNDGALGRADGDTVTTPSQVTALGNTVRSVAAGATYSVALLANGTVWAWGSSDRIGAA